ncbi:cellulose binding domain-containing protein [Myxococcus sp. CA033]|uniref:cellulose binding domain-containing protein n=1 Tax=Myxococcus sp. CA033 TaxID=2741516 RepID=UPI00157B9559|nr:cellulose binding domain-containing protein [Myxococcus sp. CA033]NTX35965.1 cellulose binding domain-containing protein [Myxococcus sp. CA033]
MLTRRTGLLRLVLLTFSSVAVLGSTPTWAQTVLDLSPANRRVPISGLPDWSKAGYRGGQNLPGEGDINPDATCRVTPAELATTYGVIPNDGVDDTTGLQAAIDHLRTACTPSASYTKLSLLSLPAGQLDVSRQLGVDASYLIIRGAGSSPVTGTKLVFRPDVNTRYDTLTSDGGDWDEDGMTHGEGKGGWLWPGRGLFRVQSRGVHTSYNEDENDDYQTAPPNRADIFEGTVNVHWKVGVKLRVKPGDTGFAARTGDTVVYLAANSAALAVGRLVNIRAANSRAFYAEQQALPTQHALSNLHMRQQLFRIAAVDTGNKTLTLDKPLEYDVPVTSTSDGSTAIDGSVYDSKAAPLVDPIVGVGIENLYFTQEVPGVSASAALHNYGNLAPAYEMHGIVFKWAADSWVRGIRAEMTGSHPIVTEEAKNLQIVDNVLDGAWNKGKGGNGYFRGSRVWDSLYAGNTSRNLRHFTFQWSASGNVVIGNDFDSDLNLHGGWERRNLFERNISTVPYAHRSGNCSSHCGEEGGGGPDDSNWYPIWWGAGKKAVKWSGATGPQNVFFNNVLRKQVGTDTSPYADFYSEPSRIYQFGWSGAAYKHLDINGTPIADWAHAETLDYSGGHGVDTTRTDTAPSLFLISVGAPPPPDTTPPSAPSNLRVTAVTSTSVTLAWDAATDDRGVSGYSVWLGGNVAATTTGLGVTLLGLSPATAYTFTATARDAAGNVSAPSAPVIATTAPPAPSGLVAHFAVSSSWANGYTGRYTVENLGTVNVTGWQLEFDLPAGTIAQSPFSSTMTRNGDHYTFLPVSHNTTIKAGASKEFGFTTIGLGQPFNCTLNGNPCE